MRSVTLVGLIGLGLGALGAATCRHMGTTHHANQPATHPFVAVSRSSTLPGAFRAGVDLQLVRRAPGGSVIEFGVPLPYGAVKNASTVRVTAAGRQLPAQVDELIADRDATGTRVGVRALRVELPSAVLRGPRLDVRIVWHGSGAPLKNGEHFAFRSDQVSGPSAETVETSVRTIALVRGAATLVAEPPVRRTLFVGREAYVVALYPPGYLASTEILGRQVTAKDVATPARAGIRYLSQEFIGFVDSAAHLQSYALNPDPESVPDPRKDYEGWLYDRCATFLLAYVHVGDARLLHTAFRNCSYYASHILLDGANAGIFSGKPDRDPKYSHLRGLYAYYALTGDERALAAGRAIAELWYHEPLFVAPYRAGHIRGPDKQWTERLLATSLEGLYYGYRLTGDMKYLVAFREMLDTAYRHITGTAADLARINPGVNLPPQNCFIHDAEQQGEGNPNQPWCSPWMSELLVDPLLRYQELTGDRRVDEIFIRLTRFLRDVGSVYFTSDPHNDSFLSPSVCDDPSDKENRRMLVPLYGAGIDADGVRRTFGEWNDFLHCPDATALTAAGLRALRRSGGWNKHPIGPFANEGQSFLQLHEEFSYCAKRVLQQQTRLAREPAKWTPEMLQPGLAAPATFIRKNKIGYPSHSLAPTRRLSWWFNTSLEQYALLSDAHVALPKLHPGRIRGPGCR